METGECSVEDEDELFSSILLTSRPQRCATEHPEPERIVSTYEWSIRTVARQIGVFIHSCELQHISQHDVLTRRVCALLPIVKAQSGMHSMTQSRKGVLASAWPPYSGLFLYTFLTFHAPSSARSQDMDYQIQELCKDTVPLLIKARQSCVLVTACVDQP